MNKKLIFDLPTRVFHWGFASLFIVAFLIAKTSDDDDPIFSYHMLAGLMLGGLVLLRLIWGVVGSKYSRFSSFALHPADLINYFKGILTGDKKRWAGHNPASSWATLIMLGSALLLAITGFLMASGQKETFEDIHELLANTFLVTVLLHIAGVFLHTLRHQDGIALTMIHGNKKLPTDQSGISGQKPIAAAMLVLLVFGFGTYLFKNYNSTSRELNFFGKTLQLGENEKEDENNENETENDHDDDDDD